MLELQECRYPGVKEKEEDEEGEEDCFCGRWTDITRIRICNPLRNVTVLPRQESGLLKSSLCREIAHPRSPAATIVTTSTLRTPPTSSRGSRTDPDKSSPSSKVCCTTDANIDPFPSHALFAIYVFLWRSPLRLADDRSSFRPIKFL